MYAHMSEAQRNVLVSGVQVGGDGGSDVSRSEVSGRGSVDGSSCGSGDEPLPSFAHAASDIIEDMSAGAAGAGGVSYQ